MFVRNSFLIVLLFYIKFGDAIQYLDRNEGESCFNNVTQQEGICKKLLHCKKPCAPNSEEKVYCKRPPRGMPIVCCPLARTTSTISALKCQEYKEFACTSSFAGNIPNGPQVETKVSNCASTTQPVIVGGEEAIRREFPHMALVGWTNGSDIYFGCGGSLISDEFVLTAAHCFNHSLYGPIAYVRLGEHDKNLLNESQHVDVKVTELFPHHNYERGYDYDDIGLLKLERPVKFTDAIRPACLPEDSFTSNKVTATGWGYVKRGELSSVLMKVSLDVFDHSKCSGLNKPSRTSLQGILEDTQFCAGSDTRNNNTCRGDSGGPLQITHKHYYCTSTIVGVTSFGKDCLDSNSRSVGVYTRVWPYLEWIESIVWPELNGFEPKP